jgi:hypothetical protein
MSEETTFWGVVVRGWPPHMWPHGTGLLPWRDKLPDGKPVHYYPLFSSREKAEGFVSAQGQGLALAVHHVQLRDEMLRNIRRLYRDEIPDDYYVKLDGGGLVTWGQLLA